MNILIVNQKNAIKPNQKNNFSTNKKINNFSTNKKINNFSTNKKINNFSANKKINNKNDLLRELQKIDNINFLYNYVNLINTNSIIKIIHDNYDDLTEIKSDLTEIKSDLTETKSDLTETKSDLTETKSDLTEIKSDLTETKSDLTETKSDLIEIKKCKKNKFTKLTLSTAMASDDSKSMDNHFLLSKLFSSIFTNPVVKSQQYDTSLINDHNTCRVILSSKNTQINVIDYECNGLVIDTRTLRALSVPVMALNYNPNEKIVNSFLEKNLYDIYKVEDGTIVTLYNWIHPVNGITWSLSSNNGYDVSSLKWMGDLTYAEILMDLITRLYPEFITVTGMSLIKNAEKTILAFTNLNTKYCYTIGFRHHNFHPIKFDLEKIWQIQHTDVSGPLPVICEFTTINVGLPIIPIQMPIDLVLPTMKKLQLLVESSFVNATTSIVRDKVVTFKYGYILKSKNINETGIYSNILIESSLLSIIKRILYSPIARNAKENITHLNKLDYMLMRSFLSIKYKNKAIALLPEYKFKFDAYEVFINSIVEKILTKKINNLSNEKLDIFIYNIYTSLNKIYNNYDIICNRPLTESIIRDFLFNPAYADMYIMLL